MCWNIQWSSFCYLKEICALFNIPPFSPLKSPHYSYPASRVVTFLLLWQILSFSAIVFVFCCCCCLLSLPVYSNLTLPHLLYLPGVFLGLGLSGVIPTLHFVISEGLLKAATMGQIGWLALMACLYITGAALYAARIPERFFPGKCDIWVSLHNDWMKRPTWKLVSLKAGGCCVSGFYCKY